MKRRIKVRDIANHCMVDSVTVRRWIKDGKLNAIKLPGGHYRVSSAGFREFLERWDMPVNGTLLGSKSKRKEE